MKPQQAKKNSLRLMTGFTLIELLVVLFIISIVTSVALLNIGRNENKQLEAFAKDLTQVLALAEEQAMLQPAVLGLKIMPQNYQFVSLQNVPNEKEAVWTPLSDNVFNRHQLPQDIKLSIFVPNAPKEEDEKKTPQIIISTNGDVTPFTIYIGKQGKKPRYIVTRDADGNIVSQSAS